MYTYFCQPRCPLAAGRLKVSLGRPAAASEGGRCNLRQKTHLGARIPSVASQSKRRSRAGSGTTATALSEPGEQRKDSQQGGSTGLVMCEIKSCSANPSSCDKSKSPRPGPRTTGAE